MNILKKLMPSLLNVAIIAGGITLGEWAKKKWVK